MSAASRSDSGWVTWGSEQTRLLDASPFTTRHDLARSGLFTDDAIARLIDRYRKDRIQVFTMGSNPLDNSDWAPVDTSGVSGAEMLSAAARGRLWIKLMRIDLEDQEYHDLMKEAYREIWPVCPVIRRDYLRPLLLISSPGALVYYHADAYPTMLWHVRGSKRVWIYPAADPRLMQPDLMEKIYVGEIDEEVPYQSDFDRHATVFDLQPGQLLTWPLNAPHRIVNHDTVNVSVSVQYSTSLGDQRALTHLANRYLRRTFHFPTRSTRTDGVVAALKRAAFRIARKLRITGSAPPKREYKASYRVDATSATGMSPIPGGPVRTVF